MLNLKQKIVIIVGIVAIVIMGMFPPWIYTYKDKSTYSMGPAGYSFIAIPPKSRLYSGYGVKLDIPRIVVQWVAVFVSTGLVVFLLWGKKNKAS